MKNIIFYLACIILFTHLTSCTYLHTTRPLYLPVDKSKKLLLSEKSVRWMKHSDYEQLHRFIRTAQPQETMQWRSRTMTYIASSQAIFLNAGKPCRCYHLKRHAYLLKPINNVETACRNTKGEWTNISNNA